MKKAPLIKAILSALQRVHQGAIEAAQRAYDTATDEANEAENKYDTLGLEASYLAQGQSRRVIECEADLIAFKKLKPLTFNDQAEVKIGALVCIEDEHADGLLIFISPVAGGLKITHDAKEVSLVTPVSPLGQSLMAHFVGDEIDVSIGSEKKHYQIISIA